jgi:enediyne biosynthesis protein E4
MLPKGMGSVLTSLISKTMPSVLGGLFLLLAACSSSPPSLNEDEQSIKFSQELEVLSKKVQMTNYGPTLKEGGGFIDKTNDYGLNGYFAVALNAVDLNFDGKTDLVILPTYYSRPQFLIFDDSKKKFIPWDHDPLPADFKASYLYFYDMNKDGIIDLVSGVLNQRSEVGQIPLKLYLGSVKNGLLTFTEDTTAIKLPAEPTSSVSIIDFDLDGWPDIFIGNWFEHKKGEYLPAADRLLRNNKGKFEEVTTILRSEAVKSSDQIYPPNARPTYGSSTCDIDQNGYPDILTASSSGIKNKLWMNLGEAQSGNRYFEDVGPIANYASDPQGSLIPTGGGRTFFAACTDYNNDGLMDVFLGELSHAYDNESVDKSSILTGSKETYPPFFLRTEYASDATSESWNQGDRRGVWVDYNLDGRIDLLVDNSGFPPYSRLVLFEQDETHAFSNVAPQLGIDIVNPAATITIDLNQDGLTDIITAQNNIRKAEIPPRLYAFVNNNKLPGRRAIKVHLHGRKANTHGLGAMVMLYTEKQNKKIIQRRWTEYSQGGLASQNESGIHFGVDANTKVLGVKVRWPYVQKEGFRGGTINEKMYSLSDFGQKEYLEVTACENGKIFLGKVSCQF